MSITFLLGNGFDRALGLETGYSAFYRWYCKQPTDGFIFFATVEHQEQLQLQNF